MNSIVKKLEIEIRNIEKNLMNLKHWITVWKYPEIWGISKGKVFKTQYHISPRGASWVKVPPVKHTGGGKRKS